MADLHLVKSLSDNKYTLTVYVDNVLEAETTLADKFGEPKVSFGGTIDITDATNFTAAYFGAGVETDSAFTIPVVTAKSIISGFTITVPYVHYEDGDIKSDIQAASSKPLAEAMMNDLADHVQRKVEDSWTTFAAQVDNFSSSSTVTL